MKAAILNIVFIVLAGIIFLAPHYMPPFIEQNPPLQSLVPAGIRLENSAKSWSLKNWEDRSYQQTTESLLRDEPYLRSMGVRLKNEVLYSLFDHNANPKTEVGDNGYLYELTYINAYLGLYNQSDSAFAQNLDQLVQLKAKLDQVGTQLLILIPPPKAYVYPAFLPHSYQSVSGKESDRLKLAAALTTEGVAHMDFGFYRDIAEQAPALLYPKTGLHWSHYGAFVGLDSLRGTLSRLLGKDLPRLQIDSLHFTDKPKAPDNEMAAVSNLWRGYPYDTLAYPHYHIDTDSNTYKPKIITIGDSYYHLWSEFGHLYGLWDDSSEEWFYYGRRFSRKFPKGTGLDKSENILKDAVAKADVLILEASAINLHRIGFGFVEQYLGFFAEEDPS